MNGEGTSKHFAKTYGQAGKYRTLYNSVDIYIYIYIYIYVYIYIYTYIHM